MTYSREFLIRWSDGDANGHVRHTVYPELAAEVRFSWLAEAGFPWRWFEERQLGPVLLREEVDYLREVPLSARVRVDIEALGVSPDGARWKLRHTFHKESGEVAARVVVLGGWLDLARRRLTVPPPELAAQFRAVPRAGEFEDLPPLERRG
jgi:acyl-CoA thioester hydrolase